MHLLSKGFAAAKEYFMAQHFLVQKHSMEIIRSLIRFSIFPIGINTINVFLQSIFLDQLAQVKQARNLASMLQHSITFLCVLPKAITSLSQNPILAFSFSKIEHLDSIDESSPNSSSAMKIADEQLAKSKDEVGKKFGKLGNFGKLLAQKVVSFQLMLALE